MTLRAFRTIGLLVLGFVGGVFGVIAYAKTPLPGALSQYSGTHLLADACTPEASEEDDIFFLSCGGVF
jgi:hypothetical protein